MNEQSFPGCGQQLCWLLTKPPWGQMCSERVRSLAPRYMLAYLCTLGHTLWVFEVAALRSLQPASFFWPGAVKAPTFRSQNFKEKQRDNVDLWSGKWSLDSTTLLLPKSISCVVLQNIVSLTFGCCSLVAHYNKAPNELNFSLIDFGLLMVHFSLYQLPFFFNIYF